MNNTNTLINSILTENNTNFNFYSDIIESKVSTNIDNKNLTNICRKYKNFSSDNSHWIIEKYREMVIQEKTENLINFNLIDHLKEKL